MSKMLFSAVLILMFGSVYMLTAQDQKLEHTKDSLDTVKENLKSGKAILLDVREQGEWDAGHLKAARLVPQSKLKVEAEAAALIKSLSKNQIIYTHCRAGGRAVVCGEILKKHGFDVRPLKAGYQALVEAGFEKADK